MASSSEKYPALVSTAWLGEAVRTGHTPQGKPVRVVDATLLGFSTHDKEAHTQRHIPGSHHVDINQLRDTASPYYYTLPSADAFAEFVGKTLGIGNDAHVVVYEHDALFKVMTAPRIWWMFRYFGHDAVSVLDGGLQQWVDEGHPVSDQAEPAPAPATFRVTKKRDDLYKSYEDVLANLNGGKFQLMDSRPTDWYDGSMPSLYPELKLGKVSSAIPLPFTHLLKEGSGLFRPADQLKTAFASRGVDLAKPLASSCFVGITACILALSAFVAGKEDVAVFDGSWDEFSRKGPEDTMTPNEAKPGASLPAAFMPPENAD